MKFAAAIIATVAANRYDSMNEDDLLVNLESTLSSALSSEARGDADAAVAKTAAIKNIQKALTARILKRLDDGQPLVEVARKMKAIEGMQPQINDMERRLGIMQSVEPVLENAIKTLQKVVDVRGMGKKWARLGQFASAPAVTTWATASRRRRRISRAAGVTHGQYINKLDELCGWHC